MITIFLKRIRTLQIVVRIGRFHFLMLILKYSPILKVYAGDIYIFSHCSEPAIQCVERFVLEFGQVPGYRLNTHKTQLILAGGASSHDQRVASQAWYLGIILALTIKQCYELNYTSYFGTWRNSGIQWLGDLMFEFRIKNF